MAYADSLSTLLFLCLAPWDHHHLIVSIWISVYQLNTSYSLLRRTDETQQGRNSCLRLQMLSSVWTLSCHCPVKLLTQYQPCIIVCYSVYFWLIRSFTDPAFTGSIFVCGPLHHHVLLFFHVCTASSQHSGEGRGAGRILESYRGKLSTTSRVS